MANVKNILVYLITLIICGTPPVYSNDFYGAYDSGIFGIMDKHFQGVLFPEAYKNLASAKIAYPGLWTSERNSASAGLLPGQLGSGWQGLYSWADISNGPGNAGVWLGNLNIAEKYRNNDEGLTDAGVFSLRGAAWITPFRGNLLKGFSLTVDIDNVYDDNGSVWERLDANRFFVNLTSLIRINDNYHLRTGIHTYNKTSEDDPSASRFDNSKLYSDGIYIGLIDDERRTLDFRADNTYGVLYSGEDRADTLSLGLRYTQGGALSHKKHILFIGVKADAGAAFISNIGEETGSFAYTEYMRNLTAEGWIMRAGVSAPIVLDVNVYGPLRCMLSIAPRAGYTQINYPQRAQYEFAMTVSDAELSLRGTAGDKFDFALKPAISNDVFMAALEIRYMF